MTDYAGATWIPSPHFWADANRPRYVIVHGTASGLSYPPEATARDFQTNVPPTSTHYIVGTEGQVIQCVAEKDAAWGNGVISHGARAWWTGNPNEYTVSIEHVQNATNTATLTDKQRAASFALIASICARHNIPRRDADASGGVTGHFSIDPVNRSQCPGKYPWTDLWSYLMSSAAAPSSGAYVLGDQPEPSPFPWLTMNRITQRWNGADETGVDLGMVVGTPITSLLAGTVGGSDVDATGAYCSVISTYAGAPITFYYQHLDQAIVSAGQTVQAGQLLGYSGGQTSGGHHPATIGSTGPHLEVGVNWPWGGGRNPRNMSPNYDPLPTLVAIATGTGAGNVRGLSNRVADVAQQVTATTGFAPLCQALHDAEATWPLDTNEGLGGIVRFAGYNIGAFFTRGIFMSLAVVIMLLVVANALKGPVARTAALAGEVEAFA